MSVDSADSCSAPVDEIARRESVDRVQLLPPGLSSDVSSSRPFEIDEDRVRRA